MKIVVAVMNPEWGGVTTVDLPEEKADGTVHLNPDEARRVAADLRKAAAYLERSKPPGDEPRGY